MSNLSLDGNTSFIGTQFIKLLNTGSSNLATEQFVNDAIIEGVGGITVDAYTKTETDTLLNNKLNILNPQTITGDLDVNGTIEFVSMKGNFISNNDINTDLKFQINSNDFITLNVANDRIEVDKDIEMHSSRLKTNVLDTWTNTNLLIKQNDVTAIDMRNDLTKFNCDIETNGFKVKSNAFDTVNDVAMKIKRFDEADDTIQISRQTTITSNKLDGNDLFIEHLNNTTGLLEGTMTFKNANEIYSTVIGGGKQELALNKYVDGGVRVGDTTGYLTVNGAQNASDALTVNGSSYLSGNVNCNGIFYTNAANAINWSSGDLTLGGKMVIYNDNITMNDDIIVNNIVKCDNYVNKGGTTSTIINHIMEDVAGEIKFLCRRPH